MTAFRVCQRVCHNMEILGKVHRAFNQASEELANGAQFVSCLCGGQAGIRTLPFFWLGKCVEYLSTLCLLEGNVCKM